MIQVLKTISHNGHTIYVMHDAGYIWYEFYQFNMDYCILHGLEPECFGTLEEAKTFIDEQE